MFGIKIFFNSNFLFVSEAVIIFEKCPVTWKVSKILFEFQIYYFRLGLKFFVFVYFKFVLIVDKPKA